eukprot:7577169-Pyramimonas_sp.AAC.1
MVTFPVWIRNVKRDHGISGARQGFAARGEAVSRGMGHRGGLPEQEGDVPGRGSADLERYRDQ